MKKLIFICLLFLLAISFSLFGGVAVTVSWDPNSEPDLAGYSIYYGTSPGSYDDTLDVGNMTSFPIANFVVGTTYFFAVTAYDSSDNESGFSDEIEFIPAPVRIDDDGQIPKKFTLSQNYPNPFNSSTNISYELLESTRVVLEVYNIRERLVDSLVDEFQQANTYTVVWDASKFSSGIYLFCLFVNDKSVVTKGLLVK